MSEPTARQRQLLELVYLRLQRGSPAPTIRELCDELEISSTNATHGLLRALAEKGLLQLGRGRARSMAITAAGLRVLGASACPKCGRPFSESTVGGT